MTGNAWEWCEDAYDPAFYAREPSDDPVCRVGKRRVRAAAGGITTDRAVALLIERRTCPISDITSWASASCATSSHDESRLAGQIGLVAHPGSPSDPDVPENVIRVVREGSRRHLIVLSLIQGRRASEKRAEPERRTVSNLGDRVVYPRLSIPRLRGDFDDHQPPARLVSGPSNPCTRKGKDTDSKGNDTH